jgi:peroxiredoxin
MDFLSKREAAPFLSPIDNAARTRDHAGMPRRQSRMLTLGTNAPHFALRDTVSGRTITLEQFASSPALLVAFICNHCPFVKHILDGFVGFAREVAPRGLAIVAISSNDVDSYPADAPDEMRRIGQSRGFTFPYLHDESQEVAKAYQAVCTPDFFLFDRNRRLVYRGQFDGSRPGNTIPVTGSDLRAAVEALLGGRPVPQEQTPSVGCSIKWKPGREPEWA